ncbi:MAG: hypothetical protein ABIO63_13590 [Casimicrobiaceae bacterium]
MSGNDVQRLVNLYPQRLEPKGDVEFIYTSVPGLKQLAYIGGVVRGAIKTNDRAFFVFGTNLCEVMADGYFLVRGQLISSTGPVSMAYGSFQLVMVDGPAGYVLRLSTNVFAQITDPDFYGSVAVRFMALKFLFVRPGSGQFYWSEIDDASNLDALDFATAESQPDSLVTLEVDHSEAYLFGQYTTEIWFAVDTAAQFQRSQGSGMEVGCMAAQSVRQIDNSIFWIGRDKAGGGIVYRAQGHQPVRVSTHEQEEDIQAMADPSSIRAWAYQDKGLTFYGFSTDTTTWVYEVSTGRWPERCDRDAAGLLKPSRGQVVLFAYDKHFMGADDGWLYTLDAGTYTNGTDALIRELTTPRQVDAEGREIVFTEFWARLKTGGAAQGADPQVELSWTDDAGKSWATPVLRALGKVGEIIQRVLWAPVGGFTRDRAWRIRFSGNAPFQIRSFKAKGRPGRH